jgi:hypothetical protein
MHDAFAMMRWRKAGISLGTPGFLWSPSVVVFLLVGRPLLDRIDPGVMLRDDGAFNANIVVLNLNRTVQRTVTVVIFRLVCRAALVCSKTGAGFPAGSAQIAVINSSFGPLVAGLLVGLFGGSFNCVTAFMTCFALLTIIAILLGCETMGDPLPR